MTALGSRIIGNTKGMTLQTLATSNSEKYAVKRILACSFTSN